MELEQELRADLKWREYELATLKALAIRTQEESGTRSALLRAMFAVLYAHYEGYFKFCWDAYLDHIQKSVDSRSQLPDSLASLSLDKFISQIRSKPASELYQLLSKDFEKIIKGKPIFENKLETNSNLYPKIAQDNSEKLGITVKGVIANSTHLKTLVGRRNNIAHGQKMEIKSLSEYIEYEKIVLDVLNELFLCIMDAANKRAYMKS